MEKESRKNAGNWMAVINPNAGGRKGEKDWPKISRFLHEAGIDFVPAFTEHRNHAIGLTEAAISEGYRQFLVVGGDGTLNEVVNGVFRQKACDPKEILVAIVPVGTGNDWGRMYGFPKKYRKTVNLIRQDHRFTQDVGHVVYQDEEGEKERYFVNVSGMGYDALVAQKTNRMKEKGKGGTLAYLLNIFTGLFQYRYVHFSIALDGEEVFNGRVLSMNLGICRYNGGGLMQLPFAIPDDGLLDVTVIKAISRFRIISNVTKLYDGSFTKLKFVKVFRGKECHIVSKPAGSVYLEADGESLGHSPLHFSVLPRALTLLIPEPPKNG